MKNFEKMTVAQLKEYAQEKNIDLGEAKTKTKILAALTDTEANISVVQDSNDQTIIGSDKIVTEKRKLSPNTKKDENGIMTVRSADTFKDKEFKKVSKFDDMENKVAIFSEKNIHWHGLGSLKKGYNIVKKEDAEKWLSRKGIRKSTPKEVAAHYGI